MCVEEMTLTEGQEGEEGEGVEVIAADGMDEAERDDDPWKDRQDGRRVVGRTGKSCGDYVFQKHGFQRRLERVAYEVLHGDEGDEPGAEGDEVDAEGVGGRRMETESGKRAARRRMEAKPFSMVGRGGLEHHCSGEVGPPEAIGELQKDSVQVSINFRNSFKMSGLAGPKHLDHQPIAICSSIDNAGFLKKCWKVHEINAKNERVSQKNG